MTAAPRFDPSLLGLKPRAPVLFGVPAPALVERPMAAEPGRTRIWELSKHLHCSIIGTCLSTAELKQILGKTGMVTPGASEHDLHHQGVLLAGRSDGAGKLLHKALDKRHRVTLNQFDKAASVDAIRALWRDAVQRGDIPGAYWAALTHGAATDALVREVFGEVHMLSHLVGAANRADIRRLSALEAENAVLQDKLRRQEAQLRDGIVARDAKIRDLSAALARRLAETTREAAPAEDQDTLERLAGDLERRLGVEAQRRSAATQRAEALAEALRRERALRDAAERREAALQAELDAVEASLDTEPAATVALEAVTLLYVGGRPAQLGHLREASAKLGADFLHHDGGVEDRTGLLAGLVSRADVVMFPVDCVSHEAALAVKRLCRQAGKPFLPLRSAGLGSFIAALAGLDAGAAVPA